MYTCHLLKCKTSTEQVMVEIFLVNNFNKEKNGQAGHIVAVSRIVHASIPAVSLAFSRF